MIWRVGVAGSPIAHSLSPQLHEAGLRLAALDGTSRRVELGRGDAARLSELMLGEFDALSITAPLKYEAFAQSHELSDVARRTQSVNSLLNRDGALYGESTDGEGFLNALRVEFGSVVENAHAVVLGAGGAASAVVDALVHHGVASVAVHARHAFKVDELSGRYPNVFSSSLVYRPVDLIVNTVPVAGRDVEAAVLQGVHHDTVAVDITYDPRASSWRTLYDEAGCRTMNGLAMLAHQAALQMQWWWGVDIDAARLLEVLR
ncbi:MAG: shikimate dehydrogenase family protein [Acidimicrobiales bacterium]